jgi:uncharacterized damage-inducible protein DinB
MTMIEMLAKELENDAQTSLVRIFSKDFEREVATTRRMLERVPEDKYDWKPHEKSMTIERLTTHIAELPGWMEMTIKTNELDFEKNGYERKPVKNNAELMEFFERMVEDGRAALATAHDELLEEPWTLRSGETIYDVSPKKDVMRMALNQMVHHRAQLGVFLRLLDIPLPGSYGPSADEGF